MNWTPTRKVQPAIVGNCFTKSRVGIAQGSVRFGVDRDLQDGQRTRLVRITEVIVYQKTKKALIAKLIAVRPLGATLIFSAVTQPSFRVIAKS